jgi:hypothetical protein
MKVFLSHSTKDKEFVQKLAAALIGDGFEAWLCQVDLDWGDNFVAKIEDGLAQCDVAVLVWSPNARYQTGRWKNGLLYSRGRWPNKGFVLGAKRQHASDSDYPQRLGSGEANR